MDFEALDEVINNYLEKFDLTASIGLDFGCYPDDEEIEYAIVIPERFQKLWTEYLTDRYPDVTAPIFIWALLHEVGHCMTNDYFTPTAKEIFREYKDNLDGDDDEQTFEYYNCFDEAIATEWAYLYIRDNQEELIKFWNEVQKELNKIYEKVS